MLESLDFNLIPAQVPNMGDEILGSNNNTLSMKEKPFLAKGISAENFEQEPRNHVSGTGIETGKPRIMLGVHNPAQQKGIILMQSKLSLLDEKSLTSFPIPPPKKSTFAALGPSSTALTMRVHANDRRISINPVDTANDSCSELFVVEDYIPQSETPVQPPVLSSFRSTLNIKASGMKKKMSIGDLKNKMHRDAEMTKLPLRLKPSRQPSFQSSFQSSLTLTPHVFSADSKVNDPGMDNISEGVSEIEECGHSALGSSKPLEDTINHCKDDIIPEAHLVGINTPKYAAPLRQCDGDTIHTVETVYSSDVEELLREIISPVNAEPHVSDKYISNLPLSQQLKYCVICEKPLYELSALIPSDRDYNEIVCGGCTSNYERAAKILEDYELESSFNTTVSAGDESMVSGLGEEPEVLIPKRKKGLTPKFSCQLLSRLYIQAQYGDGEGHPLENLTGDVANDISAKGSASWLHEAKRRLRWRWRISGLLPRIFD